jgi:hypothetical protein
MKRRGLLAVVLVLAWAETHAQQPESNTIRAGQRAVAMFTPTGSSEKLQGEFSVTQVKGAEIAGKFSGQVCGASVYHFTGRFDGETIEAKSASKWGAISVSARRISAGRYAGTFGGRYPGKVEIEIQD